MAGLRWLALGDSYTIGEGVSPEARWPHQLAERWRAQGLVLAQPRYVAKTGWTTDELLEALATDPPDGEHDLVSLLAGVNNQYRGLSLEDYEASFASLLEAAAGYARGEEGRVFVVSIPDWSVTPFGHDSGRDLAEQARQIDDYNLIAARLANARGIPFVDVTSLSRRHADWVVDDGLHPNAEQYALWASAVERGLVAWLPRLA